MFRRITIAAATFGAIAAFTAPAAAQGRPGIRPLPAPRATLFTFTPYAGYLIFGDFLRGPVGTTLSARNAPVYGAQLGMKITPNVSLVGNVAYSSTDLQVGAPFVGGFDVGSTRTWLYDGGLEFRIPTGPAGSAPLTPFLQVGAGAIHYDISAASVLETSATNFAANVGGGFDYRITPTLALRLMAKDYIGKFDFRDATSMDVEGRTAQHWTLTAGLSIGF